MLDTGVIGAYFRNEPIWQRMAGEHRLLESDAMLISSVVSWGELFSLAVISGWGDAKQRLLSDLLETLYVVDIAHADEEMIAAYCTIDAQTRTALKTDEGNKGPNKMGKNDLWIAATARTGKAILLTMDNDFDHIPAGLVTVAKYPRK